MVETPEEFEERLDKMSELIGLAQEMEDTMLRTLDRVKEGIMTHRRLLVKLSDLVEGDESGT